MKPAEAFGVVVRSVGLIFLVFSTNLLLTALANPGLLFFMVPMLAIGIWLLRGAPTIVNFAYPNRDSADDRGSASTDEFE
jgi:hypothetical protein